MAKPTNIERLDSEYVKSGRWKCVDSPTNAHHWVEIDESGIFHCKYCGDARRYPRTFDGALKAMYRNNVPYTSIILNPEDRGTPAYVQQPVPIRGKTQRQKRR